MSDAEEAPTSAPDKTMKHFGKKNYLPLEKSETQKEGKLGLWQADVGCTMQNVSHNSYIPPGTQELQKVTTN